MLLLLLSLIAMSFDIFPVLLAAILSAAIWDFFFLAPRFEFFVGKPEDMITLCTFFFIALLNAALTFKIRQAEKKARQEEEKAKAYQLYDIILNSLSHEFRTPLATIIAATDNLLTENGTLPSAHRAQLIKEISIASLRLNEQVGNLLNISRIESGLLKPKRNWCDVRDLIRNVIKKATENAGNHRIMVRTYDNLLPFELDYGLMYHLMYNLVDNALRYTPDECFVKVTARMEGEDLVLEVEDNGKGFARDELHKVFKKFYRGKDTKAGGLGLGLSLAKGIAEVHHGSIALQNIYPSGARFTITIPPQNKSLKN